MKIKSGVRAIKGRESSLDLRRHPMAKGVKGKLSATDFDKAISLAETLVINYTLCPKCAITAAISSAASAQFNQTRSIQLCVPHCKSMLDKAFADAAAKRPPFNIVDDLK